jgi:anti-sigma regulatory factor (Ser/Thr protein kinase)
VLSRHLRDVLSTALMNDAKLIASELVNNAYMHGAGTIGLEVEISSERLRITVSDEGEDADLRVEAGHGLQIVQDLSLVWGSADGDATRVWAELPLRR